MKNELDPKHLDIWRLYLISHAKIVRKIDKDLADAKQIPLNWYDVLIELYEAPDQKLRMSDIADRVVLTRSGLTRLVDKLEKSGYIIREIDPDDRRGFYAILTNEGIQAMRGAWKIYAHAIQTFFAQHLNDETLSELDVMFNTMIRLVDKSE